MPKNRNIGRNTDGTFAHGNPGKPKGSRNKATQAALSLFDGSTEQLTSKAIDLALEGDTTALRLCLERICPPRKDNPVFFDLPKMSTAQEAATAASVVLREVSDGNLTPLEGASVMGLIDGYRRTLEASEFEARLAALETTL